VNSSEAAAATICWARISKRAASGICSSSSSPDRIADTSAAHSISSSRVVANRRPSGSRPPSARAPDALQRQRDRARRADLADQVRLRPMSIPSSSDAGRDHRAQLAALQAALGIETKLSRETAMMRKDANYGPSRSSRLMRTTRSGEPAGVTKTNVCAASGSARPAGRRSRPHLVAGTGPARS